MSNIGGWIARGSSGAGGAPATAHRPGQANKQHIIYSIDANFSAAPAAAVLVQLTNPDVSPNTIIWEGYLPITNGFSRDFAAGISCPIGASVDAVVAGNGSLTAKINMHGITR